MWRWKKRRFVCLGILCLCCLYVVKVEVAKSWSRRQKDPSLDTLLVKPISLDFDLANYIAKEKLWKSDNFTKHAFNLKASNTASVDRNIPDSRHPECKSKVYDLPASFSVSVIISFHNEARSALLRTIVSVINRSPELLLKEIILIDDFSDDVADGSDLVEFPKVKVFRNNRREGLARSRMTGVHKSTGSHVVFLDSHCEVNVGWLAPLLDTAAKHPKALVSPVIDIIDSDTFAYKPSTGELKGGFDWSMSFRWQPLIREEMEQPPDPTKSFKSPVIPGGLFLVSRSWLEELGGLDKGLEIWGAENIEVSIKAWLCGGEVLIAPCSRVGHVFRSRHPYSFPPNGSVATYLRNSRRIVEVWLDEYKYQFYNVKPQARSQEVGSIIEVVQLRENLKCRPFQWYLDNVYQELRPLSKDALALGQLQQENLCLQTQTNNRNKTDVILAPCAGSNVKEQQWYFAKSGELHQDQNCLTAKLGPKKPKIYLTKCTNSIKQKWSRRRRLLQFRGLCLENATDRVAGHNYLTLNPCQRKAFTQRWDFSVELQTWGDR